MKSGIETSSAVGVFSELLRLRDEFSLNSESLFFRFADFCREHAHQSKAQLFQDLLVLFLTNEKKGGFFVEFGATNGISLSNSFLLEQDYRWKGILAEPGQCWHKALRANRKAHIDHRCLWSQSGENLNFNETEIAELSTLEEFRFRDFNSQGRFNIRAYQVETVSLNDLLQAHSAPALIDYMSVDTEGSEYTILSHFDFNRYKVRIFTIEHNFSEPDREKIRQLMAANGYTRILEPMSRWDDWYVLDELLERKLAQLRRT